MRERVRVYVCVCVCVCLCEIERERERERGGCFSSKLRTTEHKLVTETADENIQ